VAPLICAILVNIFVSGNPKAKQEDAEASEEPKSALGFLSLLKSPAQLLYGLCVVIAGCNLTFITALLQPHLATVSVPVSDNYSALLSITDNSAL
jgi:hypothetical protein